MNCRLSDENVETLLRSLPRAFSTVEFSAACAPLTGWTHSAPCPGSRRNDTGSTVCERRLDEFTRTNRRTLTRSARAKTDWLRIEAPIGEKTEAGVSVLPDLSVPLPKQKRALIHSRFEQFASRQPAHAAVVDDCASFSYGELLEISTRLAHRLRKEGVGQGSTVAIVTDRNAALVCAVLATLRAGAPFALLDASYPSERVRSQLQVATPVFAIFLGDGARHDACLSKEIPRLILPMEPASILALLADEETGPLPDVDPETTAYLMFTSGSTGTPKCIATQHSPLPHFIAWHEHEFGLVSTDRFSMLSGLSHDPLLRDIFTPLSIGATLFVPQQQSLIDPDALYEWLSARQITVAHLTPPLGQVLSASAHKQTLQQLRFLFWGGDSLRPALVKEIQQRAPNAAQVNFYGTTETPQAVAFHRVVATENYGDRIPIGRGIDDVQIVVLNEERDLQSLGNLGEVAVRTAYLSRGYVGDDQGTRARFTHNTHTNDPDDRMYLTGDLGRFLSDGSVEFCGRRDDQVKIRGYRVEPEEVARSLRQCEAVREVVVLPYQSPLGETCLAAYVVGKAQGTPSPAEISAFARAQLPKHMHPSSYTVLDRFPLLPNGKIDRAELRRCTTSTPATDEQSDGQTDDERAIAAVWKEALGVASVNVNESFFDLGGDSLTALRVLIRMRLLGLNENVCRGIFAGKTISEIARHKRGHSDSNDQAAAPMRDSDRHRLLLDILRGLLVVLLVACHWVPSVIRRLPAHVRQVGDWLNPVFSMVTPGFALAFGTSLGFVYYPIYRSDRRRARRLLNQGAVILGASVLLFAVVRAGMNRVDPSRAWRPFDNVLPYYAVALLTAPLWMKWIARFKSSARAALALGIGSLLIHLALDLVSPRLGSGFNDWLRALFVLGKFSYFNMSFGALVGFAVGLTLHDGRRVPKMYLAAGAAMAIVGVIVGFSVGPSGHRALFQESEAVELWKWLLCAGAFLASLRLGDLVLARHHLYGGLLRLSLRSAGILGQLALPVFLLHFFSTDLGNITSALGAPSWLDMGSGLVFFMLTTSFLFRRIYRLYYSSAAS